MHQPRFHRLRLVCCAIHLSLARSLIELARYVAPLSTASVPEVQQHPILHVRLAKIISPPATTVSRRNLASLKLAQGDMRVHHALGPVMPTKLNVLTAVSERGSLVASIGDAHLRDDDRLGVIIMLVARFSKHAAPRRNLVASIGDAYGAPHHIRIRVDFTRGGNHASSSERRGGHASRMSARVVVLHARHGVQLAVSVS